MTIKKIKVTMNKNSVDDFSNLQDALEPSYGDRLFNEVTCTDKNIDKLIQKNVF